MARYKHSTKKAPAKRIKEKDTSKTEQAVIWLACLLVGAVAASFIWGGAYADHLQEDAIEAAREEEQQVLEVKDTPLKRDVMPLYMQTDPQWKNVKYAGGNIGDSGCGLTAAAMAIEYMTGETITPDTLALAVGDTCLTNGVNDPAKFCDYITANYDGTKSTSVMWTTSEGLEAVANGYMVFAGMEGYLGDRYYDGHVVLIWRVDSEGWYIRDPADGANSQKVWSVEELHAVNFLYFYGIKGE